MKPSTERDYHRRIARVIEAILVDPGAPHTVESLASVAHLSPFHFHRIYRALTGESIAETVQRLRLAWAAYRLTDADDSVTTIALTVGYESPQAFARAFRGFAGVSPSEFKARQRDLTSPGTEASATGRPGAGIAGAGWPLVELTEQPPIDALCLRHHGPIATISQTFRKLLRMLSTDGVSAALQDRIGICSGDPEQRDGFCYLAGIVPTMPIEPVGDIEPVRLEGGLYAAHRLIGPYALIAPTFQALFGGWLPHSDYEPDDRPALEIYRSPLSSVARNQCVTDLMIPLRRG
jgi:AraC family transcriptional regulator